MTGHESRQAGSERLETGYTIELEGVLDARWAEWFPGVWISTHQTPGTVLVTKLALRDTDQARLRGMLNRIWDLNLNVISVYRTAGPEDMNQPGSTGGTGGQS